jgi:hypothetical protein
MVAAATLVVAAGAASAQTMKADIPFTFRAGGAVLPAGSYLVDLRYDSASVPVIYLHGDAGHHAALAKALAPHDPPKAWRANRSAMLAFQCGVSQCSLVEAWGGTERPAYSFPAPRLGRNETARIAVIALRSEKGD